MEWLLTQFLPSNSLTWNRGTRTAACLVDTGCDEKDACWSCRFWQALRSPKFERAIAMVVLCMALRVAHPSVLLTNCCIARLASRPLVLLEWGVRLLLWASLE